MPLTLDTDGNALTETIEGVTLPVDYSFKVINDFVHGNETHFEELQYLCLGMSNEIERLNKIIKSTQ